MHKRDLYAGCRCWVKLLRPMSGRTEVLLGMGRGLQDQQFRRVRIGNVADDSTIASEASATNLNPCDIGTYILLSGRQPQLDVSVQTHFELNDNHCKRAYANNVSMWARR